MKVIVLIFLTVFSFHASAQDLYFNWARQFSGVSTSVLSYAIETDQNENVYTSGSFSGTADFDPGTGIYELSGPGLFISKLDSSGHFEWAKQLVGDSFGGDLYVGNDGNVYVLGSFIGTVDCDPGPGVFELTSAGAPDVFIIKLNTDGDFVWAKRMGGADNDTGYSIEVDQSGNIYTVGYFYATADFDPGPGTFNLTPSNFDVFISKLDASGNFVWAKQLGGTAFESGASIKADLAGNIFVTGQFQGTADFDPGAGTFAMTTPSFSDNAFICKLDSDGNFGWAKQFSGIHFSGGSSIHFDALGNVYTTGTFGGTTDFDPGPGDYTLVSAGSNDVFVSKLDASGNFLWAKQFGAEEFDLSFALQVDKFGNSYTTGSFMGTVDFDPGPDSYPITSSFSDAFISKLDADGNFGWVKRIGGTLFDEGADLRLQENGNLYITGHFSGTSDFNPGPAVFNMTAMGYADAFVLRLTTTPGIDTPDTTTNPPDTTGAAISELSDAAFTAYPNPTSGKLNIQLNKTEQNLTITLFTSLGQLIDTQIAENTETIAYEVAQPAGIYLLEISEQTGKRSVLRIIKQ